MQQFWQISGILLWILVVGFILLRLFFGDKWPIRASKYFLLGPALLKSSKKLADELPNKVKRETLAEVATYSFLRLTKIGLVGLLLAGIPIWLLYNQNQLLRIQNDKFDLQNEKIDVQNALLESDRRSSLVLLMSTIMEDVGTEIADQRRALTPKERSHFDTVGYSISDPLIGRIAALSQGFLPYKLMVDGKLTDKEYSIERGQLLLALVNSALDTTSLKKIYRSSNFDQVFLSNAKFSNAYLNHIRLNNSLLDNTVFENSSVLYAEFYGASLNDIFAVSTDFSFSKFRLCDLQSSSFDKSNFAFSAFEDANLKDALFGLSMVDILQGKKQKVSRTSSFFDYCTFSNCQFEGASFHFMTFNSTYLCPSFFRDARYFSANFENASYFPDTISRITYALNSISDTTGLSRTTAKLSLANSVYQMNYLPNLIEKKLRAERECLFTKEGCFDSLESNISWLSDFVYENRDIIFQ